jgi:hypothetical protein
MQQLAFGRRRFEEYGKAYKQKGKGKNEVEILKISKNEKRK